MNYFELYPGDYRRDTARLSLAEHGVYLLLLADYYASETPLPADIVALCRIAGAQGASEQRAVKSVADQFFPVGDDGLRHNSRADREIAKAQKRINAARRNGAGGGRKPGGGGTQQEPGNNPLGIPAGTQWDTRQLPQQGTHSGEALQTPDPNTPDTALSADRPRSARKAEPGHPTARAALDDPDPEDTPAVVCDPEAWGAFVAHHRQIGRWTAARSLLAAGQLRTLAAAGVDTGEVLRWATLRGLSDLADCHRRMQADAAKAAATDRLPGESLADACYRRGRAKAAGQPAAAPMAASGSLAAELLALTAEGADR